MATVTAERPTTVTAPRLEAPSSRGKLSLALSDGLAITWRNVIAFLAGVGVLLLFSYTLLWGFATLGLFASSGETAQLMVFPVLMPLTFISGAFVPIQSMPSWLQVFARNQPVNAVINASRAL